MSTITSQKWISSLTEEETKGEGEGRLVLHDTRSLFQPVWNNDCNLISIFGRARQGKSFMMNCLAGEEHVFKVSNYKESCTQGIDISNKWMSLPDFSRVDGGRATSQGASTRVGFVDAEGQGDKDVSYDANLICPILLASKCVIFNWKGDLQKDHILSTLGIMTRAAKNVSAESSGGKKKFGHLHILFRDWQSIGSTAAETFATLFNPESSKDAQTRNQIREDVKDAFESIQVWLFEAPTDSVSDLRQVLTIQKTTARFRQQIRDFRQCLVDQLKSPVLFAGRPLSGKGLHSMMKDVIHTLNRGEVILPSSTYLTMMREELSHLLHSFQQEVQRATDLVSREIEKSLRFETEVELAGKKKQVSYFLNETAANGELRKSLEPIRQRFLHSVREVIGVQASQPLPPQFQGIFSENETRFQQVVDQAIHLFTVQFHSNFVAHLKSLRQVIEKGIEEKFQQLASAKSVTCSPTEFKTTVLPTIIETAMLQLQPPIEATGGKGYYHSSEKQQQEVDDSMELLQRFYSNLHRTSVESFESRYKVMKDRVSALFAQTCKAMEEKIPLILQQLTKEHKKGFPKSLARSILDQEYKKLDEQLKNEIISLNAQTTVSPFLSETHNSFFEFCHELNDFMTKEYETLKQNELVAIFHQAEEDITRELSQLSTNWEGELQEYVQQLSLAPTAEAAASMKDANAEEIMKALDDLTMDNWRRSVARVLGWLADSAPKEKLSDENFLLTSTPLGEKLFAYLKGNVDPFKQELRGIFKDIERRKKEVIAEKQRQEASRNVKAEEPEYNDNQTVRMDESDDDLDDEDESEEEGAEGATEEEQVFSQAKRSSKVSVGEQRRKAREFAERVLGISFAKGKATSRKSSAAATTTAGKGKKKTGPATAPRKSLAQQREDAKQFAMKNFGNQILEPDDEDIVEEDHNSSSRRKSSNKRSLDEPPAVKPGEEIPLPKNKKAKLSSSSTERTSLSANPPAPPIPAEVPKKKEDPLAAARRAAQEAAAQRQSEVIQKATDQIKKRGGKK
jgi:hypothetical protein